MPMSTNTIVFVPINTTTVTVIRPYYTLLPFCKWFIRKKIIDKVNKESMKNMMLITMAENKRACFGGQATKTRSTSNSLSDYPVLPRSSA